jgi:alpha/beta superfamily hydrolase
MKISFITVSLMWLMMSGNTIAQNQFIGDWQGKVNVGVELTVVLHVRNEDGKITSTLDSPDQNVFGIQVDETSINGNEFFFGVKIIKASFTGKLVNDSTIAGTFSQIAEFPLTLSKTNKPYTPTVKPQTPQPPFPYISEEIEFENADKSIHFGAVLTRPDSNGPFAAAILITGSGQQDRDATIMGHKPFAIIADHLTKNGFAVLRMDDRGVGKTTGNPEKATSADFSMDIMSAMDYLKTRSEIDPNRIGLIGHSEGGLIASIVLTRRKDVAFVISLAGPGIKGADILAEQAEYILSKDGIDPGVAKSYSHLYRKIIGYSLTEEEKATAVEKTWIAYQKWKTDLSNTQLEELGFKNDEAARKIFNNLMEGLYLPWMQYFNNSSASVNFKKAYSPVLALNGSADIQVTAERNLAAIKKALQKSKSRNYEIKEMPGLNHLFQHCITCSVNEYGQLEESFAPEVLEIMTQWLKKTIR